MDEFERYFGLSKDRINPNCIICPINDASLFFDKNTSVQKSKGLFLSVTNRKDLTIISTKNSFFLGDAILQLKDTPAQNICLFGSCASTGSLDIGSKILVDKAFAFESFTEMLKTNRDPAVCYPDKGLTEKLYGFTNGKPAEAGTCTTVGSLVLEKSLSSWFVEKAVSAVDMESSIVFSAAEFIKRKAAAILYVTDIVGPKPFFEKRTVQEAQAILRARKEIAGSLKSFLENA